MELKDIKDILNEKGRVYLAAGWFDDEQFKRCEAVRDIIKDSGFRIYSPKDEAIVNDSSDGDWRKAVFDMNVDNIKNASFMVCITDKKDIGCFVGSTRIKLMDGTSIAIKDMIETEKGYYIYSINDKGDIVPGFTKGSKKTRLNSPLVKVILDNNEEIICTPDHPFMLRSGEYVEAQNLLEGAPLMPLYIDNSEYYRKVYQPNKNEWELEYRLSAKSIYGEDLYKENSVPPGQFPMIHHKDFNKNNNRPDNLIRIGNKDHFREHAKHNKEVGNYYRRNLSESRQLELKEKSIINIQNYNTDEKYESIRIEQHKRASKQMTELMNSYWDEDNKSEEAVRFRTKVKESARKHMSEYSKTHTAENNRKRWQNKEFQDKVKKKISETNKIKMKGSGNPCYGKKLMFDPVNNVRKFIPKDKVSEYLNNGWILGKNHEVRRVEKLDYTEDVYGIQVDPNHNYALDAGVFVSNTIFEAGEAHALGVPIVYFAETLGNNKFNLMLAQSGIAVVQSREALKEFLNNPNKLVHLLTMESIEYDGRIE